MKINISKEFYNMTPFCKNANKSEHIEIIKR